MPPGAVRHQAEELNEVFRIESRGVLVRHGIGHCRAEEIYQEACPEEHHCADPNAASARVARCDLLLLAVRHAWQAYRQMRRPSTEMFPMSAVLAKDRLSVKSFCGASLCFRCLFFASSWGRIGFERMKKTA